MKQKKLQRWSQHTLYQLKPHLIRKMLSIKEAKNNSIKLSFIKYKKKPVIQWLAISTSITWIMIINLKHPQIIVYIIFRICRVEEETQFWQVPQHLITINLSILDLQKLMNERPSPKIVSNYKSEFSTCTLYHLD